jgi:hypothetical protein
MSTELVEIKISNSIYDSKNPNPSSLLHVDEYGAVWFHGYSDTQGDQWVEIGQIESRSFCFYLDKKDNLIRIVDVGGLNTIFNYSIEILRHYLFARS